MVCQPLTSMAMAKGQLISKCLFGIFTFFQKTNENKSTSSKVKFVCSFFGRNVGLKKSFRICQTSRCFLQARRPRALLVRSIQSLSTYSYSYVVKPSLTMGQYIAAIYSSYFYHWVAESSDIRPLLNRAVGRSDNPRGGGRVVIWRHDSPDWNRVEVSAKI